MAREGEFLTFGGGLNEQDDISIQADECVEGENFLLDRQSRSFRPRPPFDLKGTAANAEETRGIMQLVKRDGSYTTLSQNGDTVYSVDSSFVYTSVGPTVNASSKLRGCVWSLTDKLYVSDLSKLTKVLEWDGSTLAVASLTASGFTDLYSSYIVDHQNRLWHFNIKTDTTDLPHVIMASKFEAPLNYDRSASARAADPGVTVSTASQSFWLVSPDLKPINGVAVFYDTLLISTEGGRLFALTGTDATNYRFVEYYAGSSAIGPEGMTNIGNDVMFASIGPSIELLSSTDRYGDVATDDASRWISSSVQSISDPVILVYDQKNQCVCFFCDGFILVYDKNIGLDGQFSPWMKWTTQLESGLSVSAAAYVYDPSDGTRQVYFGGPNGEMFRLRGESAGGDADETPIRTFRKTRLIVELDTIDNILTGRVTYRRKGEMTLSMSIEWSENYVDTNAAIKLKGPIVNAGTIFYGSTIEPYYYNDTAHYNEGGVEEDRISTVGFSPQGKADSFFMTLSANTEVQFLINRIEV